MSSAVRGPPAQPASEVEAARLLRIAGRALARAGLVHAYGHCSVRLDAERFLVSPPKPLGLVIVGERCTVVPIDGPLPEGVLGEVRAHREIYRCRPQTGGIVRSMPPHVMTLAAHGLSPRPRHGFGAYFHPQPPLWDDIQLVRSDERAVALARTLGSARAVVMRGNGAVVAAASLQEAVVLTWYLEDAARIDLAGRAASLDAAATLSALEARERAVWDGRILERMWDYLTAGDPETSS